jgi:hypothetical protein
MKDCKKLKIGDKVQILSPKTIVKKGYLSQIPKSNLICEYFLNTYTDPGCNAKMIDVIKNNPTGNIQSINFEDKTVDINTHGYFYWTWPIELIWRRVK